MKKEVLNDQKQFNQYKIEKRKCTCSLTGHIPFIVCMTAITVLGILFLFSSCEKKELCYLSHPHSLSNCHTSVWVTFNADWNNKPLYSGNLTRQTADLTESVGHKVRYIFEFWETAENGNLQYLIKREIFQGNRLTVGENKLMLETDLPSVQIAVLCWAEPLPEGNETNPYFNTEDLQHVIMTQPHGWASLKDAFTSSTVWDYREHAGKTSVQLNQNMDLLRPLGCYTAITNDIAEYHKDKGANAPLPFTTKVSYQLWIPSMFNVYLQTPINPIAEVNYEYTASTINENQMVMAEDILFIGTQNSNDNYFNLILHSYAENGNLIYDSPNAEVRLQRNRHTLFYGAFLTDRKGSTPGIDDSFDNEIIIEIPE